MKPWTNEGLLIDKNALRFERRQCIDEGKDLSSVQAEFDALLASELDEDLALQARAGKLLDRTARLRVKPGHPFREPSDLVAIRKARRGKVKLPKVTLTDEAILEKVLGAWLGRSAGCLLGKPVEGRRREEIEGYLRAHGQWPLKEYFPQPASEEIRQQFHFPGQDNPCWHCYAENITCMVEDDDTNYTTTGLAIVKEYGKDFTPANVARFWLCNIPIFHTFTAERVAYRNLVGMVPPPGLDGKVDGRFSSASYRNVAREWIGAQIRADFFGYVNPANPERAAEYAWRDACISHVKNGIYGEMWVAAMLASAYVIDRDVEKVIRAGMGQIPARSRLHADLTEVLAWHKEGLEYAQAVDRIHKRWDENTFHHWCHTNSNAQIVAMALLWGQMDFGQTISYAVMAGLDTDCNGASAGSVLGLMLGGGRIPSQWTDPMNDTLLTGVAGYHTVKLSEMARNTLDLIRRDRPPDN